MCFTTFPTEVWVLQPSFKPKKVELTSVYSQWHGKDYYLSRPGKVYHEAEVFSSQADAIADGRRRLAKQQADLDKKQVNLNKRKAALDAAEAV